MVTLSDALAVLFPAALPLIDYVLVDSGSGQHIAVWRLADPLPSADQLAAVTADQVTSARLAKKRAAAAELLATADGDEHVAIRAADGAAFTHANTVAECWWAALTLVCQRAGVAVPTASEIAAQVTALRTTDPGVPADQVADQGRRRLTQPEILTLIGGVIQSGGGDPIQG